MSVAFGEFVFDPGRRELRKNGSILKVDPLQLDLLACFIANPGRLLSKQELLDNVWEGRVVADNVLSVTVAKLRKALGHRPGEREYIENRYGRGYRFIPELTPSLESPASSIPPPETIPPTGGSAPLVGRRDSLQRLDAALTRALAGKGSVCVLIGEPGIGKTRLAEALEQTARDRSANAVWGRYQPGSPPLWPFVQALRGLHDMQLADELVQQFADRHEGKAELAFDGPIGSSHHRTVDAATQALFRLSKQKPLVILLDDLQWADALSLRLLGYLVDDISRWPLLIVTTLRSTELLPESRRNQDLSRLLRHRNCERVELARLGQSDIDEYVAAMFGADQNSVSRVVYTRSEGNPFFMVELLRPWLGRSGAKLDPEQLQLSGLALDLVRQRVQELPELSRNVLSAAALIGHDFDLGLLSYVTERESDELLEALDGSLANDTLRPSADVAGAYAFDHELIREVLYADLPALERCRLHYRAAEGLERRRSSGAEIASAEIAHHFLAALPHGDVARAIDYARRAATRFTRLGAATDARAILRRALASLSFWPDPDPETRTQLLLELAMVERMTGEAVYLEHLEQAVALARQHGFGALLTVAGRILSPAPGLIPGAGAHAVLQAAADVLPASDESRRAIVLAHLAWTPPECNSARRVNALLAEAQSLAERSGQPEAFEALRDAKLFFMAGPKTLASAEAIAVEIERAQRALPSGARRPRNVTLATFRLITAMQRGDQAGLERALEARETALARLGNIELNWHHERMLMVMRLNRGELGRVAQDLAQLRERGRRFRLQAYRTLLSVDFGMFLLRTSDPGEFGQKIRDSLTPSQHDSPSRRARKLRSMADFGLLADLERTLQQISIESLYDLPCDRDYLTVLCNLAQGASVARSVEHARALYELLSPYPDYYGIDISFHSDGSVSYYLARLSLLLGQEAAAQTHYERALELHERMTLRPYAALTSFELGSLLLDSASLHDAPRGLELLAQAERAAEEIGMRPLAESARERRQRV
ncbi:MAG TPA: AAA family ATPase [Polyangiales bacterium]|nr:AAA family ATPase [Polyangiales bacterium]